MTTWTHVATDTDQQFATATVDLSAAIAGDVIIVMYVIPFTTAIQSFGFPVSHSDANGAKIWIASGTETSVEIDYFSGEAGLFRMAAVILRPTVALNDADFAINFTGVDTAIEHRFAYGWATLLGDTGDVSFTGTGTIHDLGQLANVGSGGNFTKAMYVTYPTNWYTLMTVESIRGVERQDEGLTIVSFGALLAPPPADVGASGLTYNRRHLVSKALPYEVDSAFTRRM